MQSRGRYISELCVVLLLLLLSLLGLCDAKFGFQQIVKGAKHGSLLNFFANRFLAKRVRS